jgi:hypothetical protein
MNSDLCPAIIGAVKRLAAAKDSRRTCQLAGLLEHELVTTLRLDIDPEDFARDLVGRIQALGRQSPYSYLATLVLENLRKHLEALVGAGSLQRYKVSWRRPGYGCLGFLAPAEIAGFGTDWQSPDRGYSSPHASLVELLERQELDLGYFEVVVVGQLRDSILLAAPLHLRWLEPVETRRTELKTVQKIIFSIRALGLQTDSFSVTRESLKASCGCPQDTLMPRIDGVWNWVVQFVCKVCGRLYVCECFRTAIDKAAGEKCVSANFMVPKQAQFREGICHLCADYASDLYYCHPMYGSKVMVRYGPYIRRTAIEKGLDMRSAENLIRQHLGIPDVGEGWISEVELLRMVRQIFPEEEVIHQASPPWLSRQRFDVFIPRLRLAIEYQGRQHYDPIEHFEGEDGLRRTQERDARKSLACEENGISLVLFRYDENLNRSVVEARLKGALPAFTAHPES